MDDIVGISDSSGNLVASYTYDAWGKVTSVTGSNTTACEINPFKYCSYCYDRGISNIISIQDITITKSQD